MQLDENNLKIVHGKWLDLHNSGSPKTSSQKTIFWLGKKKAKRLGNLFVKRLKTIADAASSYRQAP